MLPSAWILPAHFLPDELRINVVVIVIFVLLMVIALAMATLIATGIVVAGVCSLP